MSGIGTTQTATEYADRYSDSYDLAWWISAEQTATIGDQFTNLVTGLGQAPLGDPETTLRNVRRVLRARDCWLLIFDKAEDPQEVSPPPPGGSGHVTLARQLCDLRSCPADGGLPHACESDFALDFAVRG
jgi:hypothetical protein